MNYRIENKADSTTMFVYDEIGYWGVTAQQFVKDLESVKSKTIHLRINSPGGSVFDGTSIYNALKQHPANVIVHIDGLAASISSIIALAGNEIRMSENAFFMIHEPWSMTMGTAEDLRKEAELLDKVRGTIASIYIKKSGMSEDEVLKLMADETWMTAAEALALGFIDAIDSDQDIEDASLFDLSAFTKVPEKLMAKEKKLTAQDIEIALKAGGCTQKMAKAIISEGFKPDQRDVAVEKPMIVVAGDQRDVAPVPQVKAGTFEDIHIRTTILLATKGEAKNENIVTIQA
jgi:ATP-dependent Clp endopeptidase proteolytic subunit ClpP